MRVRRGLRRVLLRSSEPRTVWSEVGVPPALLETEGEHFLKTAILACKIAEDIGLDKGQVLNAWLNIFLNDVKCDRKECLVALIASHIATAYQAKRYASMGLSTSTVLKREIKRVLQLAEGLEEADVVLKVMEDVLKEERD